jgi:adenine-specific DNA-methyltransferase
LQDESGKYSLDRLDKQSLGYVESLDFPIIGPDGTEYTVEHKNPSVKVARWRWSKLTVSERYDELVFKDGRVYTKNYKKNGAIPRSLLIDDRFGRTRTGKTTASALFDDVSLFDNPKPIQLISFLSEVSTGHDDIILDFFSGSATTAHAVMQLNSEDGGNRKWIMVQLPEETDEKSEAFKAGYKTIPEISRERIRRAGDKIASEHPDAKVDYGFRALKIDSLNEIGKVELGEIQQTELLNYVDNFHDDRNAYDLLYGYLIHAGMPLNGAFELKQAGEQDVMFYDYLGEGTGVVACLEMSVSDAAVQVIAEAQPLVAVFRDGAFQTSQEKINVVQKIKAISPETQVKVL